MAAVRWRSRDVRERTWTRRHGKVCAALRHVCLVFSACVCKDVCVCVYARMCVCLSVCPCVFVCFKHVQNYSISLTSPSFPLPFPLSSSRFDHSVLNSLCFPLCSPLPSTPTHAGSATKFCAVPPVNASGSQDRTTHVGRGVAAFSQLSSS